MTLSEAAEGRAKLALQLAATVEFASRHSLFRKLAAIEACTANPFQPHLVWERVFDRYMQLDLREEVAQQIFLYGCFEPELTHFFARVLKPSMVFYDVGAHIGYFTALAARLVEESGAVVAFEPIPTTRMHLETNVRNAEVSNTTIRSEAVWSGSATLSINDFGAALSAFNSVLGARRLAGGQANATKIEVQAVALDEVAFARKPDVVKIDAESAEWQVLNGMRTMLAQLRPIVTVEVGDFPDLIAAGAAPSRQSLALLQDHDYVLFDLTGPHMKPHVIKTDETYTYANIVAAPREKAADIVAQVGTAD